MAENFTAPEWRLVQAFPDYEVSVEGAFRTLLPYRRKGGELPAGSLVPQHVVVERVPLLNGSVSQRPRVYVWLLPSGQTRKRFMIASRLICRAFHGEPPTARHEAAHNDGDPTHNHAANLRWATPSSNQMDRRAHGTANAGSRHGASVLTEAQVIEIRRMLWSGARVIDIAAKFAVSASRISRIRSGDVWAHVLANDEPAVIPSRRKLPMR